MPHGYSATSTLYRRVAALVRPQGIDHRRLHRLLKRDRFAERVCLTDGRSFLEHLSGVCEGPLAEGIERSRLLADLMEELGDPNAIEQGSKGTCAAAAVQILCAAEFPAEYVRLVAGLASPDGRVRLFGGHWLEREPGTEQPDRSRRRVPSRLLQPAFMEVANGVLDYCNRRDANVASTGDVQHRGLYARQQVRLLHAVTGRTYVVLRTRILGVQDVLARVAVALELGHLVPCGLDVDGGRHAVLVRRIRADEVLCYDSWARHLEMESTEFTGSLRGALVPAELAA